MDICDECGKKAKIVFIGKCGRKICKDCSDFIKENRMSNHG